MAEAPGTGPEFQEGSSLLAFMESRADMNIDWSRHGGARWRGFIDGAREVLEAVGLLLKA
jgi:hypothetical protein